MAIKKFARKYLGLVFLVGAAVVLVAHSALADSVTVGDSAGVVHLAKTTDSTSDSYTNNPTPSQEQWIAQHYARIQVFSPYWDSKLSWYPNGWSYQDAYAIYTSDTATITAHPSWILKDANGNDLYIDWGCSNGTCPQYAADISNPAFRQWWISNAAANLSKGYKGLFIDDVNMDWRISNGTAEEVPIDPNTGQLMTLTAWQEYFVQFLQQIRAAFPNYEIVDNAIAFAGGPGGQASDPYIQQQIQTANYQFIEHGVTDGGITGDGGQYSLQTLQKDIDYDHSVGVGVVIGTAGSTTTDKEYSMANYFLTSNGSDLLSNNGSNDFWDTYWTGYDTNMGTPLGARYVWNGLIRRDFTGGIVLVNPPGAATISVTLPASYIRTNSSTVNSITLGAKQGAVLVAVPVPVVVTPPPVVTPTPTSTPGQDDSDTHTAPTPKPSIYSYLNYAGDQAGPSPTPTPTPIVSTPTSTPVSTPTIPTPVTPPVVTTSSSTLLTTELNAFIAQFDANVVSLLSRNLSIGSSGVDVRALQILLNDNGYLVSQSGAGSPGNESTYFGQSTSRAIARFQSSNRIPVTGALDATTRAYMEAKW